jgi:hypothetical protein
MRKGGGGSNSLVGLESERRNSSSWCPLAMAGVLVSGATLDCLSEMKGPAAMRRPCARASWVADILLLLCYACCRAVMSVVVARASSHSTVAQTERSLVGEGVKLS